jgi:hypothetical protein
MRLLVIASIHLVASTVGAFQISCLPRGPKFASGRATPTHALLPPEFGSLPVEAFVDPASQALGGGGEMSPVADIVTSLIVLAIAFKMIGGGLEEEPAAEEEDESSRTGFGWLQADLRVPLPTLSDLRDSCHLIGQHDGYHMYLCGQRQPDDAKMTNCAISQDFTTYYGTQVYVCQGQKSEMSRL